MNPSARLFRRRVTIVFAAMGVVALALVIQLIRVQFGPYAPVFAKRAEAISGGTEDVLPVRGMIYDRDGRLLATNEWRYYTEIEAQRLSPLSRREIATVLSELLALPFDDLYDQLTHDWVAEGRFRVRLTYQDGPDRWPVTVDQVAADVINSFLADPEAPDLSGLDLTRTPRRVYPSGALAGHVLGFVNQEGKGFFGVEGYYDEWLSGKPITIERPLIPPEARLQPDPPAGVNIVLTIDTDIQQMVEVTLQRAVEHTKSVSGQIMVMDPRNGEILALAAWPELDPNNYEPWLVEEEEEQPVISPAVAGQFEPGSTFKVLTMGAALDAGAIEPEDVFIDTGEIEVGGHIIRNWDGEAWGPQTMVGCLEFSLNVCLAHVAAEELGAAMFYQYLADFGIGQLTGVDMAGEVGGKLRTPRHPEWTEADLGTNSFGQGVSVTSIQLLAAAGALANEGVMMQPHFVRQVVGPNGVYWPQPTVLGRPISPQAAETLGQMLAESIQGETRFAVVAGYELAGKTGTAQIPTEYGYDPRWTIASFLGWGPVSDPRFVVLVRLDRPRTSPWGSEVAAPVFQSVVRRLVVLLEVPPDAFREQVDTSG
jgi:cell division protein FtsI/penicillin-binding protein 2